MDIRWYIHDYKWEARWDNGTMIYLVRLDGRQLGNPADTSVADWNFHTVYTSNDYDRCRATFENCTRAEAEKQGIDYCRKMYPNAEADKLLARQEMWKSYKRDEKGRILSFWGYRTQGFGQYSLCAIIVDVGGDAGYDLIRCRLHSGAAGTLLGVQPREADGAASSTSIDAGLWWEMKVPVGQGVQIAKRIRGDTTFAAATHDRVTGEYEVF